MSNKFKVLESKEQYDLILFDVYIGNGVPKVFSTPQHAMFSQE